MRNEFDQQLESVMQKLIDTQTSSIINALSLISEMQNAPDFIGGISQSDSALRMPYSSMPKLTSRSWK